MLNRRPCCLADVYLTDLADFIDAAGQIPGLTKAGFLKFISKPA